MAIINLYEKVDGEYQCNVINHNSNAVDWLLKNINTGQNFSVYEGELSKDHEISRDFKRVYNCSEVSVFILPASGIEIAYVVAAVFVVVALTTTPKALGNLNRGQQSPNNSLTDRNNKPRPNQRIVDICGSDKSIPDVLSREYVRYVNDSEERVGYYCVARHNLLIEDIKEGDTLIKDIEGASVGVYGANRSPNDLLPPDIQIGDPINEPVYSVTQSADAIGQTIEAPNQDTLILNGSFTLEETGVINDVNEDFDFTDNFVPGSDVNLVDIKVTVPPNRVTPIGRDTHKVLTVEPHRMTFDISDDTSWGNVGGSPSNVLQSGNPFIELIKSERIGPFKMTSFKMNKLLVNVGALNGIYKENSSGRKKQEVDYNITYQKLDDDGQPIGTEITIEELIVGNSSKEKGQTTEIDLGGETFVQWSVERTSLIDFSFDGNIVDQIKVRSVFGLANVDKEHFGNITTIQTKRTNRFISTATKTPELNCIATELVQKYQGDGVFDTEFTPNTQAMQSLIRVALDPFIGRREESELDLDLLLSIQSECETYFDNTVAGEFNYSFDSTSISAQETFTSIAKAAFMTIWREGRLLKGWFESPQSIPSMVFTHRSKQPNAETWSRKRQSADTKDSIEFTYTDSQQYTKETLFFPEDKTGTNPARIELTGIKGKEQAFWHMMREFNKKKYQEITVDFGATEEGRFVKPGRLISVVKGSRVYTYDGYVIAVDGLNITLSQEVVFTAGDGHSVILKNRDGSTESITVFETESSNIIKLVSPPTQTIYTDNDELKTEFSFGNEARLDGQLMMPQTIAPSGKSYVKIKAVNYSPLYYTSDMIQSGRAFSDGFDDGFS